MLDKIAEKSNLITFDSDAPKSKRLLYIGTNNYQAGKVAGRQIVKLLPQGRKDRGLRRDLLGRQRRAAPEGHRGRDRRAPASTIVDKREDNTDRAKARSNVEDIVNAHHDLAMVVGLYNYNGPAIAAALDGPGQEGQGAGGRVRRGRRHAGRDRRTASIQVTVVQKPFMFGYLASKWMHELATKAARPRPRCPPTTSSTPAST